MTERYGDRMLTLNLEALPLTATNRSDPMGLRFIHLTSVTLRAKMVSNYRNWTTNERVSQNAGNWKAFSRLVRKHLALAKRLYWSL